MVKKISLKIVNKLDNSESISAIRRGLIMIIPILMIGAFARVLMGIPIDAYQNFLKNAFSGAFLSMLKYMYNGTMGIISLYMGFAISVYYMRHKEASNNFVFGCGITTVASFMVLSGINLNKMTLEVSGLGVKGMFTAILCGIIVPKVFLLIVKSVKLPFRLYADGVDLEFNDAIICLVPTITIVIVTTLFNYMVCQIFEVDSFQNFYVRIINSIFSDDRRSFVNGFKFVVVSGIFWFLGVYGSDVLQKVSRNVFETGFYANIRRVSSGYPPQEILTKEFFNVFVWIGGCGTALCLLITILFFSKRKMNKNLAKVSSIPLIFNINEILTFGYPIIYNAYLLAPFIVVPSLAYVISYFAMKSGWVPMVTHHVDSTVPVFISGYQATGSIRGSILQLIIVVIGVLIYLPFVRMYESSKNRNEAHRMKELTNILKKAEADKEDIELMKLGGIPGALAKCMAADIKSAIEHEGLEVAYQLQYDNDRKCIGAETLMRYTHPVHGRIYPPLIVKIADEAGYLSELERYLYVKTAQDYVKFKERIDKKYKISVNVTVATILEKDFMEFLQNLKDEYHLAEGEICIEITEQMEIKSDTEFEKALNQVKEMGFLIAIDDFSMGSTSVKYLQTNKFDIVKLDGSIVKEMMTNERSRDIISSIVYLAKSLDFKVLAEYVESEEEMEALRNIGCDYYQGYYFSKAVSLDEFIETVEKEKEEEK